MQNDTHITLKRCSLPTALLPSQEEVAGLKQTPFYLLKLTPLRIETLVLDCIQLRESVRVYFSGWKKSTRVHLEHEGILLSSGS